MEKDGQITDAGRATDSPLGSLNRDIANNEKTLWDSEQSQSIDATLDHRLLSKDGWSEIADDIEGAREGIEKGKNFIIANLSGLDDELKVQVGEAGDRVFYEALKAGKDKDQVIADLSDPALQEVLALINLAEQDIRNNGKSKADSTDTTNDRTPGENALPKVTVEASSYEANAGEKVMHALGDASRHIQELYNTDPEKAERVLFLLSVATGGPAKAVAAKAAEAGMEKAGITEAIASISDAITENIAAGIHSGNMSVEDLRESIALDKNGDDALLKDGTGFFFESVLGISGTGGKKGSTNESKITKESDSNGNSTSGADNVATYPKLKDDLNRENLQNIANQDSRLGVAISGDGTGRLNFGVGTGSASDAAKLGNIWVGDGARALTDGSGLISADGTRVYRYPTNKTSPHSVTNVQANFEVYEVVNGKRTKISNGHLDIL